MLDKSDACKLYIYCDIVPTAISQLTHLKGFHMPSKKQNVIKPELPGDEVYQERAVDLLSKTLIALLVVFIIGNLSCLILFFLNAFQVTILSDTALCALAAATIAEVAGLITIIVKGLTR
jgi:hypothetical protein